MQMSPYCQQRPSSGELTAPEDQKTSQLGVTCRMADHGRMKWNRYKLRSWIMIVIQSFDNTRKLYKAWMEPRRLPNKLSDNTKRKKEKRITWISFNLSVIGVTWQRTIKSLTSDFGWEDNKSQVWRSKPRVDLRLGSAFIRQMKLAAPTKKNDKRAQSRETRRRGVKTSYFNTTTDRWTTPAASKEAQVKTHRHARIRRSRVFNASTWPYKQRYETDELFKVRHKSTKKHCK